MKRGAFLMLGLVFTLSGLLITASSINRITGFAVIENFISGNSYIVGLLLLAGGLMFLMSGDLLQRKLGQMEKKNPSESLKRESPSLFDRAKTKLASLARMGKVSQVPQKDNKYSQDSDYQPHNFGTDDNLWRKQYRTEEERHHWMKSGKMVEIARDEREQDFEGHPETNKRYGFYFDIDSAHDKKKEAWKKKGIDYDKRGKIKEKLKDIRRGYLGRLQDSSLEDARKHARAGNTGDVRKSLARMGYASRELEEVGSKSKPWGELVRKVEEDFDAHAPRVHVSEFLKRHPGEIMVHTLPYSVGSGSDLVALRNNNAINGEGIYWKIRNGELDPTELWKNFLDIIVNERPTISASSMERELKLQGNYLPQRSFGNKLGILIGEGDIYTAHPSDISSIAVTNKIRDYGSGRNLRSKEAVLEEINSAVQNRGLSHNEFVVGKPEVTGLFADPNYVTPKTFNEIREKAQKLGVPFYNLNEYTGLHLDEPVKKEKRKAA